MAKPLFIPETGMTVRARTLARSKRLILIGWTCILEKTYLKLKPHRSPTVMIAMTDTSKCLHIPSLNNVTGVGDLQAEARLRHAMIGVLAFPISALYLIAH